MTQQMRQAGRAAALLLDRDVDVAAATTARLCLACCKGRLASVQICLDHGE